MLLRGDTQVPPFAKPILAGRCMADPQPITHGRPSIRNPPQLDLPPAVPSSPDLTRPCCARIIQDGPDACPGCRLSHRPTIEANDLPPPPLTTYRKVVVATACHHPPPPPLMPLLVASVSVPTKPKPSPFHHLCHFHLRTEPLPPLPLPCYNRT